LQYDNNINIDGTTHKHDYFLSGYIPKINKLYYKKKTINCHTYENDHHGTSNEIINSLKTYSIKDKKNKYYIYNNFLDGDDIKENIDNNIDYNQILATKNNNMNKEMFKYIKKEIDSNKNSYNYHNKLENIKTRITDLLDFYNILLTKKLSNQNL
jgi:ribosome-interacting GTPase 1